jgi:hypothetical protein
VVAVRAVLVVLVGPVVLLEIVGLVLGFAVESWRGSFEEVSVEGADALGALALRLLMSHFLISL